MPWISWPIWRKGAESKMEMLEFVLNCLEERGVCAVSQEEQDRLTASVGLFLKTYGVREDEQRTFHKKVILSQLGRIREEDLKACFLSYPIIRAVRQIVLEYKAAQAVPESRRQELYGLMAQLYRQGLHKYVPLMEVQDILDRRPCTACSLSPGL